MSGIPPEIDTSKPHPARIYDYGLGGKNHFAADREVGDKVLASLPTVRTTARENRAFLGRTVRYLAEEAGIRQFLDIGTGLPTTNNVHEVAQSAAPSSHIVYVDNDPMVLAHARALLTSSPEGRTAYIHADLRDPAAILANPVTRDVLDFSQPIALMLVAVLHFIQDEDKPAEIIATLLDALPPGSYLTASHVTGEHVPAVEATDGQRAYQDAGISFQLRDSDEFARLAFTGLELVPPGVVLVSEWRPEGPGPRPQPAEVSCYGGVARKPLSPDHPTRPAVGTVQFRLDMDDKEIPPDIDTSRPHTARMYDYYLGGKDHFAADREAADKALASWPSARTGLRENRKFLGRAVRYLAAEAGIRQFLDIGTGLPTTNNVHEVAQAVAPSSRVVYADNDPMVLAHARALLTSSPEGRTAYIHADLRNPAAILANPATRDALDFSQPIALMLVAILHFIPDEDKPAEIVQTLLSALPSGSYFVASHLTMEHDPAALAAGERAYHAAGIRGRLRDSDNFAQIAFSGLELVPPGVVLVSEWRPEGTGPRPTPAEVSMYGGVARKP